jgi:hypothetical protein
VVAGTLFGPHITPTVCIDATVPVQHLQSCCTPLFPVWSPLIIKSGILPHNSTSDTSLFTAHCTLHTDFRVVESGECITTQPIHVSYCSGACGNSSSIPLFREYL